MRWHQMGHSRQAQVCKSSTPSLPQGLQSSMAKAPVHSEMCPAAFVGTDIAGLSQKLQEGMLHLTRVSQTAAQHAASMDAGALSATPIVAQ